MTDPPRPITRRFLSGWNRKAEKFREKWSSTVEELHDIMRYHARDDADKNGGDIEDAHGERAPLLLLAQMYMQEQSAVEGLRDLWASDSKWAEFFLPQVSGSCLSGWFYFSTVRALRKTGLKNQTVNHEHSSPPPHDSTDVVGLPRRAAASRSLGSPPPRCPASMKLTINLVLPPLPHMFAAPSSGFSPPTRSRLYLWVEPPLMRIFGVHIPYV